MWIGVGQRTETIVVFLTRSIPQGEFDMFSIDLDIGDVVLENGRDIDLLREQINISLCFSLFIVLCPLMTDSDDETEKEIVPMSVGKFLRMSTNLGESAFRKNTISEED
jgi:hypothetical protein